MKQKISVFIIHRWEKEEIYKRLMNILDNNKYLEINNLSMKVDKRVEKEEFWDDYACGLMTEADIIILVPDAEENEFIYESNTEYIGAGFHHINDSRIPHGVGYIREIQMAMFDSCNQVPVLIVGYSMVNSKYYYDLITKSPDWENRIFRNHFYMTTFDNLLNQQKTIKLFKKILEIRKRC
jgi:hypothetical protein